MSMNTDETKPARTTRAAKIGPLSPGKRSLVVFLCLAVIMAGAIGAVALIKTAPQAQKRPPEKMAPMVMVQAVYPDTRQVIVRAMGSVVPARELTLKSRVAGEVVRKHPEFTQGGIVREGELLLEIDDTDYKLIVAQKQSAVADARYALKLELGRQDVARREWQLLNQGQADDDADSELALRRPHLEKARSDLVAAEAELEAARLQLARTRIYAPFNAIIRSTSVEQGSHVAANDTLASLAGTDAYWVQTSVPVDRLQWINVPDNHRQSGDPVSVTYNGGSVRQGRVVKLLSDLEAEGRMARLIVVVEDPLNLKVPHNEQPAMLIGEYVRVQIEGQQIQDAFQIPRTALRDNSRIWIAGPEGRLEIREVRTVWRDTATVLLTQGLRSGDQVVVSDLAAPIPGMPITLETGSPPAVQPASAGNDQPGKAITN